MRERLGEDLQRKLELGQQLVRQREQLVAQANQLDAEILRLQGEVRYIQQLLDSLEVDKAESETIE